MWVAQTQRQTGFHLLRLVLSSSETGISGQRSQSHKVAEMTTGTNSCLFTSANTNCLTTQSKWLIWWGEWRAAKSWERNEKDHSAVPSLSGSCDLMAGSDITLGWTASTSSIKYPQRNGDGGFFLQTPAACSRLARTLVGYRRVGGESETSGESEDGD